MHSHNPFIGNTTRAKDRTARRVLNNGRTIGEARPYVIQKRNLVNTVILDTELLDKFIIFCSAAEEYNLTDVEMLLFRMKQSTEVEIAISETEREQVFDQFSAEIMALVNYQDTTDKVITEEWRIDSEKNQTGSGTWL